MNYKNKITSCRACEYNDTLEHKLYHETGLGEGIIKKLKLTSIEEIKETFKKATLISPCYISLNGRRTKFKVKNEYLFPKELIDLLNYNLELK